MKRDYYIFSSGRLRRKDNTVRFTPYVNGEQGYQDLLLGVDADFPEGESAGKKVFPIIDINSFYIMGNATMNTDFIEFMNTNKIPAHFFNFYGYYTGSFYPKNYLLSGFLIVHQVKHYSARKKRLFLAGQFIKGAAKNILKNLNYYGNRKAEMQEEIEEIESLIATLGDQEDIHGLMNIEARIRKIYYSKFNDILASDIKYTKREFNPPTNPLNALISFGNSLVYTTVLSELYHTQIDPTVSFLHEPGARRFSLALDVAEIFKPFLADRIIFKMLNKKILTKSDFETELNSCYLKESGRKKFVAEFDAKLKTTIKHRELGRNVSYKRLIRLECYKLIKHFLGEQEYSPFVIWW